jgi:surface polysaccharide O-acyltransferase-like enzyme
MRRQRIDFFRLCAVFLIVCGHTLYYGQLGLDWPAGRMIRLALSIGVRYAIPFFFILAGYFTGGKILREPSKTMTIAYAYTGRLALVFLFWCFIYAVEQPQLFFQLIREHPVQFLFEGSRVHLWFLVSMIITVWLFALWPFPKNGKSFLALGGVLYLLGLLGGSYQVTPIGINLHVDTRYGAFFSVLFFAIGVAFSQNLPRVNWKTAAAIACGGLVLYTLEAAFLKFGWGSGISAHDYLLGTVPFGIGVSLLALTGPDTALDKALGPYGRYTLGIYVVQFLFIDLFMPLGALVNPMAWIFIFPVLVFALSLITSLVLSKTFLRLVFM